MNEIIKDMKLLNIALKSMKIINLVRAALTVGIIVLSVLKGKTLTQKLIEK